MFRFGIVQMAAFPLSLAVLKEGEDEMGALKEGVILGVKKAPLTVASSPREASVALGRVHPIPMRPM